MRRFPDSFASSSLWWLQKIIERFQCVVCETSNAWWKKKSRDNRLLITNWHVQSIQLHPFWCVNMVSKQKAKRKKENINVDFNNFLSHLFPLFSVDKIYLEFAFLRPLKLSYGSLKNTEHRVRLTWSPNKIHFKAVSERIYIISTYLHFRFICQVKNYNKIMSVMLIIGQTGRPIVKHTSRGRNYLRRSEVVKN